jgi:hypothetical protein
VCYSGSLMCGYTEYIGSHQVPEYMLLSEELYGSG